jgi:hypothetical protein
MRSFTVSTLQNNFLKKDEMGGACSIHGVMRTAYKILHFNETSHHKMSIKFFRPKRRCFIHGQKDMQVRLKRNKRSDNRPDDGGSKYL